VSHQAIVTPLTKHVPAFKQLTAAHAVGKETVKLEPPPVFRF
jgi:hypothetical protein